MRTRHYRASRKLSVRVPPSLNRDRHRRARPVAAGSSCRSGWPDRSRQRPSGIVAGRQPAEPVPPIPGRLRRDAARSVDPLSAVDREHEDRAFVARLARGVRDDARELALLVGQRDDDAVHIVIGVTSSGKSSVSRPFQITDHQARTARGRRTARPDARQREIAVCVHLHLRRRVERRPACGCGEGTIEIVVHRPRRPRPRHIEDQTTGNGAAGPQRHREGRCVRSLTVTGAWPCKRSKDACRRPAR